MKNVLASDIIEVVQKYKAYINSICRRFYIAGGTAEDLFEEGVIGLLEACQNYNGESLFEDRFDAFAKLCIKRQIIDAIKKANTNKNKVLNEALSLVNVTESGEEVSKLDMLLDRTTTNDPLELFIDKEKIDEWLDLCDKHLSAFEKEVLGHYLAGEKQSEIAKSLDKDVKSIDNTLQRIKTKLK